MATTPLLPNRAKHNKVFADTLYQQYMQLRFGINTCKPNYDYDLSLMRKDIVDWEANEDGGALNETSIQYQTWLAVTYDDVLYSRGGSGYITTSQPQSPTVGLNYIEQTGPAGQNIIQVNAGGCITRINLNPSIIINQNTSYLHTQAIAATVWDITHNLSMIPNVTTEDLNGVDIEGIIEVIDNNRIKIYFNQATAGKAYLS